MAFWAHMNPGRSGRLFYEHLGTVLLAANDSLGMAGLKFLREQRSVTLICAQDSEPIVDQLLLLLSLLARANKVPSI